MSKFDLFSLIFTNLRLFARYLLAQCYIFQIFRLKTNDLSLK